MSVKVKKLEWIEHPSGGLQAIAAGLARYRVHRNGMSWYLEQDYMGSIDDPQAAAQADFERRILSAIEQDGEPRAAAAAAFEEAAKIADEFDLIETLLPLCGEVENSAAKTGQSEAAERIAEAIRARAMEEPKT